MVFPLSETDREKNTAIGDNNGDKNRILLLIKKEPSLTAKQMSEQTGYSTRKISRIVKELRESGQIACVESARKGCWIISEAAIFNQKGDLVNLIPSVLDMSGEI